jgi:steroid delta-isomerase-like uncharacterized protein
VAARRPNHALQRTGGQRWFSAQSTRHDLGVVSPPPLSGSVSAPNPSLTIGGVMSEDNKARIREFIDRVLTAGEVDATGDYFHDDMVEEVPFPAQGPGLDGLKETLTRIRQAFPDLHWSIEEQMAEGNNVLTRFIWSGTHQGEFLGIPATNRVVRVWGMVIDRFEGQKVKSTRILLDTLSLLQQLGVVPAAPESGADPNAAR